MCGIAGVFSSNPLTAYHRSVIERMNNIQQHRGPDDEGIQVNEKCILGHRRLSIIDLSRDGHQPFISADGRYQMVYNGEIYNYIELREELKKLDRVFLTQTDTEVLLTCYIQYGSACLDKLNGMFAFAIYDTQQHTLFLARDRFGKKPLYYTEVEGCFYFASEIKALRIVQHSRSVNLQSLFDFLCFNRTDVFDETFLNEIRKIPKGHYGFLTAGRKLEVRQWWNPEKFIQHTTSDTPADIYRKIEELICSAVALRMRSDVPVGSCLSGGLDSSVIAGILYQKHLANENYKTFTVSFPGHAIDETHFIDLLQQRYGFKNFRTCPTADSAFDEFERFTFMMDEPCTSPTFYSQYKVMELARQNGVTVLLDGQGGDESFAGYQYFHAFFQTYLLRKGKVFSFLNEVLHAALRRQEKESFQTLLFQNIPDFLRKMLLYATLKNHVQKDFFYTYIDSSRIFRYFFNATDLNTSLVRHFQYKLEHLLRTEDRNSMAFSIEARLPYLDYRFVEYALSVPQELKITKGENKILQKRSLGKYTIPEILNRKDKIGFGTPGELWMQTEKWQKRTAENYDYLLEKFPGVFRRGAVLKNNLFERWKVNQLAVWHRQVWMNPS
ncbi:MAG: asparagine synthetase B [Chitinophagales bacterium]|nr:MAG: asparagine synthetase B [Chitinophagales bacterium]